MFKCTSERDTRQTKQGQIKLKEIDISKYGYMLNTFGKFLRDPKVSQNFHIPICSWNKYWVELSQGNSKIYARKSRKTCTLYM